MTIKRFKFVTGFIVGGLLFGSVSSFAANGSNLIEVFYNVKDIKINKVSKMPKEDKPFVHNGSTYVPLRFVAEALGQPVKWVPKTQTILIGETGEEFVTYLGEKSRSMNYKNSFMLVYEGKQVEYNNYILSANDLKYDNLSNKYENFLVIGAGKEKGLTEFALNGQYKKFKAKFALPQFNKDTKTIATLKIQSDGQLLLTKTITAGDFPSDIDIDVKGYNKLTFTLESSTEAGVSVGLYDARLTK